MPPDDLDGRAVWRRILAAVEALLDTEPGVVGAVPELEGLGFRLIQESITAKLGHQTRPRTEFGLRSPPGIGTKSWPYRANPTGGTAICIHLQI